MIRPPDAVPPAESIRAGGVQAPHRRGQRLLALLVLHLDSYAAWIEIRCLSILRAIEDQIQRTAPQRQRRVKSRGTAERRPAIRTARSGALGRTIKPLNLVRELIYPLIEVSTEFVDLRCRHCLIHRVFLRDPLNDP